MPAGLTTAVGLIEAGDLAHVEALRRRVLAFCATHGDALTRANAQAHLTASALVVDPADGRFVLLHHRKAGRWLQPGGHADGDGDLAAVALREATEETGLADLAVRHPAVDLDVHLVHFPGEAPHEHLDLRFLVLATPGSAAAGPPPGNDESHEVRWVAEADLDALAADPSTRRLVSRGRSVLAAAGQLGRPRET
jgi:8-oxo-dGTP pyrophosphatase MutT (NUDIX family)